MEGISGIVRGQNYKGNRRAKKRLAKVQIGKRERKKIVLAPFIRIGALIENARNEKELERNKTSNSFK